MVDLNKSNRADEWMDRNELPDDDDGRLASERASDPNAQQWWYILQKCNALRI